MSDLAPCPFCGGKAKYCRAAKAYHVYCETCGSDVMVSTLNAMTTCQITKLKLEAFDKWNKRAQPTIAEFFADDDVKEMIEKTKCKVVTIASLKEFKG